MINRLRKSDRVPSGGGGTAGFVVKQSTGIPSYNLGVIDGDAERRIAGNLAVAKDANFTVEELDNGKTFLFDSTTPLVATLPAVRALNAGMRVRFAVKQLTAAGLGHSIVPDASDKIYGNGLTSADGADLYCAQASDREGDMVELESDGVDGWLITAVIGTWSNA